MAISGISSVNGRICIPGELLYSAEDGNFVAGNGAYSIHGRIHSSLSGVVRTSVKKNQNGEDTNIVEVCGQFDEKKYVLPQNGAVVTARVESLCLRYAKCSILCVADTYLMDEFTATLRKEDVRDLDKDKVELFKCVQPGDIILARVIGVGDSQTSFLLSICEREFGVKHAFGIDGQRMEPESLTVVKDVNSDYREPRKCCQTPNLNS